MRRELLFVAGYSVSIPLRNFRKDERVVALRREVPRFHPSKEV